MSARLHTFLLLFRSVDISCTSRIIRSLPYRYNEFKDAFEAFATAWGMPMPELKARESETADGSNFSVLPRTEGGGGASSTLWDDDQTATFYESLPDLAALVPQLVLARDTEGGTAADDADDADAFVAQTECADRDSTPADPAGADAPTESAATTSQDDHQEAADEAEGAPATVGDTHDPNFEALRQIYEQLARCGSMEQADEIVINFCFIQTKGVSQA